MNPTHGHDIGDPGYASRAQFGPPAFGQLPMHNYYNPYSYAPAPYGPYAGYAPYGYPAMPPVVGTAPPNAYPWMPNGANVAHARQAGPAPVIDPDLPAAHMNNSTGGTGCEPGYNYFFPPEHCKIHVLKTPERPWQITSGAHIDFHACHVPVTTTCADLLKGFGATNPVPKMNHCIEVVQGGNGRWYRGVGISGDDKGMMKKEIQEIGWDKTRSGQPGEKPVVVVWVSKNGG
ncbi:hypothetical protein B0T11DRAFT_317707 [Plectosphaerella cucumerina]|uniref:Uncharacterized protein n=1 Tax=Plectosphaerella cucumerina TaxID=40658 RepID=A0A8K0TE39_9PEZI|nr:hypothetical protein B0T11DRAFT_317707 [Plectosphaerella cucumerina]